MSLTKEQLQVVVTKNKNLLVSASAGSGKTYTMIERIFHLLKNEKMSIKQLLIVTFTNAAASEMKQKIVERILEEVNDDDHLKFQLDEIIMSDISTLHTFCAKLVKQYFYEASIDPASKVMEDDESEIIKNDALTKVIKQFAEKNDQTFDLLFETYNKKRRDEELRQSILNLYNFLKTKHDYPSFIEKVLKDSYTINLNKNASATYINNWFLIIVSHYKTEFEKLKLKAKKIKSESLLLVIENVLNVLSVYSKTNSYTKNLKALNNLEGFVSMPRKVEGLEEELKAEVMQLKSDLKDSLDTAKQYFGEDEKEVKNAIKNAKPLFEKLLELVVAFDNEYKKLKKERAVLDFNDLEHYTLQILQNESIQNSIKNRYEYVFIDEYQDTNQLQEEIIKKIVKQNNAFMVGDVKQSIYMFRECDPQIFVNKYEAYETDPNSVKIDLNQNFRSERGVLEFANFVFSNIMREDTASVNYKKNATFVAGANYSKSKHAMPLVGVSIIDTNDLVEEEVEEEPKVYSVKEHIEKLKLSNNTSDSSAILEAKLIANKIYEFMQGPIYDAKLKTYRAVNYNDIAILSRVRGDFLKTLCRELERYNLPLNAKSKETIFDSVEAGMLHNYFRLINNEHDDIAWFSVLSSHMCNLTYDELANIRIHSPKAKYFYEAVINYKNQVKDDTSKKINLLFNKLEAFRQKLTFITLEKLAQEVVEEYDLINYLYSLPNGEEKVENLNVLVANLKKEEFENSLFKYLNYLENLGSDEEFEINANTTENAIAVTTIHASKGLEYPIVIVAGVGREFNSKPKTDEIVTNKELGFGVRYYNLEDRSRKNTLVRNACQLKNKEEELAEEMRLLYVAITRAKNHLWLVGKINLQKVETLNSVFGVRYAKSYLHWVLGSLNATHINALKLGTQELNVPMFDGTNCKFEVVNTDSLTESFEELDDLTFEQPNLETVKKLQEVFEFEYANKESEHILTKSSVSEIMQKESEDEDNYSIRALRVDEVYNKKQELDFSQIGTVHHAIMQHINFNCETLVEVQVQINNLINNGTLPKNTYELVDTNTIVTALKEINALTKNATCVKKEQQFMMYVPYNQIFYNSKITDKILVQGVIDLIIEKESEVIIVDYKTSRLTEQKLQEKYATQLRLYEMAYEKAYNKKVTKKLIYSFHLNNTVNV
ncbi:MAG: helicase-exonuclease AddAB subunit AddA [Tenericutes bacterium HGW-Tenericutes-4]|nr:MAG: helicase-exonuclease AddAB subunit AddA [Tenericutes bacterium HGW-Tenericutes-4]